MKFGLYDSPILLDDKIKKEEVEAIKNQKEKPIVIDGWRQRLLVILVFTVLIFLMFHVNYKAEKSLEYYIGAFATVSFIYMIAKLLLSFFYQPIKEEPKKNYRVSVVMPSYNENIESVRKAIDCLFNQDYPIYEIIFIDDGSSDLSAYNHVMQLSNKMKHDYVENELESSEIFEKSNYNSTNLVVHRFKENKGKREAMAWGFKQAKGDMLMLVDSDGYIYPDATRELLKPFYDEKVYSVVGHINARNMRDNLVTKMQDVLYQSAFRVGRAAQSLTGSVLVCSGALSMHRASFINENIDEFLKKKVLGVKCENGDDRCLTDIALKCGGKTKYQSTALCVTDVPKTPGNFFKQQVRWAKSFYLYTFKTMGHAWKRPIVFTWLVCEGFLWLVFSVSQAMSIFNWSQSYFLSLVIFSIGYFILSSFITGVYYVFKNPLVYVLAPILALIHMIMLLPIRVYALLTINREGWGTR